MPLTYQDQEQLRMLSIFHYIVAALLAMFACIPLIHVTLGIAMLMGAFGHGADAPPAFMGLIFVILGGLFIVLGLTLAICTFLAGRYLAQCKHYTFCLVVAALCCLWMPFGTVLGVFTIIVLMRPQVKEAFTGIPAPQPTHPAAPMPPVQPPTTPQPPA
ncbi:MAG TPA: hypothetical protein VK699_21310 [Terriglobales bacterium]|jgi:hypothetical protein|nr:hypothetical protein [Terriglobales bacterium]